MFHNLTTKKIKGYSHLALSAVVLGGSAFSCWSMNSEDPADDPITQYKITKQDPNYRVSDMASQIAQGTKVIDSVRNSRDIMPLGEALSSLGVRKQPVKLFLHSSYYAPLCLDLSAFPKLATILSHSRVKSVIIWGTNWWTTWSSYIDKNPDKALSLKQFIEKISKNPLIEEFRTTMPNFAQARDLMSLEIPLPFTLILATGSNHIYSQDSQDEVQEIASMLKKKFKEKVQFDVPSTDNWSLKVEE